MRRGGIQRLSEHSMRRRPRLSVELGIRTLFEFGDGDAGSGDDCEDQTRSFARRQFDRVFRFRLPAKAPSLREIRTLLSVDADGPIVILTSETRACRTRLEMGCKWKHIC